MVSALSEPRTAPPQPVLRDACRGHGTSGEALWGGVCVSRARRTRVRIGEVWGYYSVVTLSRKFGIGENSLHVS